MRTEYLSQQSMLWHHISGHHYSHCKFSSKLNNKMSIYRWTNEQTFGAILLHMSRTYEVRGLQFVDPLPKDRLLSCFIAPEMMTWNEPWPMWQFGFLLWNSSIISRPIDAAPQMSLLSDDRSAFATIGCLLRNMMIGGTTYDSDTWQQQILQIV